MSWEHLLKTITHAYYTLFLMQLISLLVICIYIFTPAKSKSLLFLFLLSTTSFLQVLITEFYLSGAIVAPLGTHFDQTTLYIYIIVEVACCSLYIKENIESNPARRLILASTIIYEVYIITYWILHFTSKLPFHIEISEGFLIIIFCLYFFYELFTKNLDTGLLKEPSFWAISGMLLLFNAITPFFLFFDYFRKRHSPFMNSFYIINNLAYSILFITFIIAILCNRKPKSQRINSLS